MQEENQHRDRIPALLRHCSISISYLVDFIEYARWGTSKPEWLSAEQTQMSYVNTTCLIELTASSCPTNADLLALQIWSGSPESLLQHLLHKWHLGPIHGLRANT